MGIVSSLNTSLERGLNRLGSDQRPDVFHLFLGKSFTRGECHSIVCSPRDYVDMDMRNELVSGLPIVDRNVRSLR